MSLDEIVKDTKLSDEDKARRLANYSCNIDIGIYPKTAQVAATLSNTFAILAVGTKLSAIPMQNTIWQPIKE